MTSYSPVQFAEAVTRTIQGASHLFRELDHLHGTLFDALRAEPDPLRYLLGTPREPSKKLELNRQVRDQYHFLFGPGSSDAEEIDDTGDQDDEEEAAEDRKSRRTKSTTWKANIEPLTTYLAVSVVLHDASRTTQEPHVRYWALRDWSVGSGAKSHAGTAITIGRDQVIRMLRNVDDQICRDSDGRIQTVAKAHKHKGLLSVRVPLKPVSVPLIGIERIEGIDSLAQAMKTYWRQARDAG